MQKNEFEKLFREHYQELLAYSFSFVKNIHDAEEVVQDVFLSFWEKREQRKIVQSERAYLFAAVRYTAINFLGRKPPKTIDFIENINKLNHTKSNHFDTTENGTRKLIREALKNLPDQCRTIFILSRFTRLTYTEIAAYMLLSEKTVENQIGIALKKIKKYLGDNNAYHIFFLLL